MSLQMAMLKMLHTSAKKRSHTRTIQTIKHFPPLIADFEKLEHLGHLLSIGEERDLSRHLMLRAFPGPR
jgi:hypothetical protein